MKLSKEVLENAKFKLIKKEDSPFKHIDMDYYVRNSVVLFKNRVGEDSFYIGYADMVDGKYYAVMFRWISEYEELKRIYEAITNREL